MIIKLNVTNYGFIFPKNLEEKDKTLHINKILEKTNDLIIDILNNNIFKLDYLITWSKYYFEIIEDQNNFKLIRNFV